MNDDNLQQQEEKTILKDLAKKGISKTIKAMPLKTKLIIFGVIAGIVLSIIMFVSIMAPIIMILLDLKPNGKSSSGLSYYEISSGEEYLWPIGGSEKVEIDGVEYAIGSPTTTYVYRGYIPSDGHYALDISQGGTHYIVATASGKVLIAQTGCDNNGYKGNYCNGGLGNYVILDHLNGNYSVYGHMLPNSVTVATGDVVKQGQILGLMGNSGNSTGQHLHFQLEIGGRGGSQYGVDPLAAGYIKHTTTGQTTNQVNIQTDSYLKEVPSNKSGIGSDLIAMLHSWESTYFYDNEHQYYKIYDGGDGTLTVGYGVTFKWNKEEFAKRGVDTSTLHAGDKLSTTLVDEIEAVILERKYNEIKSITESNGITLEQNQIDALIIRSYNYNTNGFVSAYKNYGNTYALYENYMSAPITAYNSSTGKNEIMPGLIRRRDAEWTLFHEGIYRLNS